MTSSIRTRGFRGAALLGALGLAGSALASLTPQVRSATMEFESVRGLRSASIEFVPLRGLRGATFEFARVRGIRGATIAFTQVRGVRGATIEFAEQRGIRSASIEFDLFDEGRQIEVFPISVDFGVVPLGSATTQIVTITNVGFADLTVSALILNPTPQFALVTPPSLPVVLGQGQSADVTIEFAPQAVGPVSATLEIISDDDDTPALAVSLNGEGGTVTPSGCVLQVLQLIDEKRAIGELLGAGPAESAPGRVSALINMIEAAGDLITLDNIHGAIALLRSALSRADGVSPPPDFVTGPATSELAARLQECIALLEQ